MTEDLNITESNIHYSRQDYREEYLKSLYWKNLSCEIIEGRPICQFCNKNKSSQVHHLTYKRLHHEEMEDLAASCGQCHRLIHYILDYTFKSDCQIAELKKLISKHKSYKGKYVTIDKNFVDLVNSLDIHTKKIISSFFKYPITELIDNKLLGSQITKLNLIKLLRKIHPARLGMYASAQRDRYNNRLKKSYKRNLARCSLEKWMEPLESLRKYLTNF